MIKWLDRIFEYLNSLRKRTMNYMINILKYLLKIVVKFFLLSSSSNLSKKWYYFEIFFKVVFYSICVCIYGFFKDEKAYT